MLTKEFCGLVKKDENLEVKRSKTLYPNIEGTHNLIDTKRILSEFAMNPSNYVTPIFVDLLLGSSSATPPHLNTASLYPVTPSTTNFSGPYLTPRRHLEYCAFWAGTSIIGGSSIFYVLLKLK